MVRIRSSFLLGGLVVLLTLGLASPAAFAQCPPGQIHAQPEGTCIVDGEVVPKYEMPLVIPPVMNNDGVPDSYDIAVRQFQQQILPGGIWNFLGATAETYPATTVWSYGPAVDPKPDSTALGGGLGVAPAPNSQFNYPAYTVESMSNVPVAVQWINDLKGDFGVGNACLQHLLPVDQTLHWANPPGGPGGTDTHGMSQDPYTGPVPIVTHVHGAHVDPHSDGYPEAWWLPACDLTPFPGYATKGTLFDDSTGVNDGTLGYANYLYRNDQPATTLWYHDHALGMTRSNVYAGPAGFWLLRGGLYDRPKVLGTNRAAKLPGPGPRYGQSVLELNLPTHNIRQKIREIPIVIQDRSFVGDGSTLFYPDNRDFFEGLAPGDLASFGVQFAPTSDVAPIWNPEAFFNIMVVNGVAWPELEVAPALYRLRFLNGCNSRFLWLKFDDTNAIVPVYQIGAEQGFLPAPLHLNTLDLDESGDGTAQILMGLAERADTIVDFRGLADGTTVELLNIAPDEPFGGGIPGTDFDPADPNTTGRVMQFRVNSALLQPQDARTTDPSMLDLMAEPALGPLTNPTPRLVSLNEEESGTEQVCFDDETEEIVGPVDGECPPGSTLGTFGPTAALLGTVNGSGSTATGNPLKWTDSSDPNNLEKLVTLQSGAVLSVNVTENPALNSIEQWDIYNFTVDAHPIHLHLVRFEVVEREIFNEDSPNFTGSGDGEIGDARGPEGWESGFKDTVIAYPGEITRVKALFDIEGLYVWHCHIVEHEDNEMMRPYAVGLPTVVPAAAPIPMGIGGVL